MTHIQKMRERWGIAESLPVADEHRNPGEYVSTFHLAEVIGHLLDDDHLLATGCSGQAVEIFQLAIPLSSDRDIVCSWSLGSMGFGIPIALGACIGSGRQRTICVEGDAGIQLNIQDLATIHHYELPIVIFVLNNDGMASMRTSQSRWFGRTFGADEGTGLSLPPLQAIAAAYGLAYYRIDGWGDLTEQVRTVMNRPNPIIVEVPTPLDEQRPPQQQVMTGGWVPVQRKR